jgi:hypothetical protein
MPLADNEAVTPSPKLSPIHYHSYANIKRTHSDPTEKVEGSSGGGANELEGVGATKTK